MLFNAPLPRVCFIAVLALCAMTCAPMQPIAPPANTCAGNGNGVANRESPLVCVALEGDRLVVNPDPIEAFDVLPNDKTKPVMIHWVAQKGGTLSIDFDAANQSCVEKKVHCANGHCHAQVLDVNGKTQCKYKVTLDGRVLDPDVIITDCC